MKHELAFNDTYEKMGDRFTSNEFSALCRENYPEDWQLAEDLSKGYLAHFLRRKKCKQEGGPGSKVWQKRQKHGGTEQKGPPPPTPPPRRHEISGWREDAWAFQDIMRKYGFSAGKELHDELKAYFGR